MTLKRFAVAVVALAPALTVMFGTGPAASAATASHCGSATNEEYYRYCQYYSTTGWHSSAEPIIDQAAAGTSAKPVTVVAEVVFQANGVSKWQAGVALEQCAANGTACKAIKAASRIATLSAGAVETEATDSYGHTYRACANVKNDTTGWEVLNACSPLDPN